MWAVFAAVYESYRLYVIRLLVSKGVLFYLRRVQGESPCQRITD